MWVYSVNLVLKLNIALKIITRAGDIGNPCINCLYYEVMNITRYPYIVHPCMNCVYYEVMNITRYPYIVHPCMKCGYYEGNEYRKVYLYCAPLYEMCMYIMKVMNIIRYPYIVHHCMNSVY